MNSHFQRLAMLVLMTCALTAFLPAPVLAQFPPPPGTGPGLPETIEAIENARITTRILYVTAHPDDESAATLTYLARGLHADVALLGGEAAHLVVVGEHPVRRERMTGGLVPGQRGHPHREPPIIAGARRFWLEAPRVVPGRRHAERLAGGRHGRSPSPRR